MDAPFPRQPPLKISFGSKLAVGGMAGIAGTVVVFPADTVKAWLQAAGSSRLHPHANAQSSQTQAQAQQRGLAVARRIYQTMGVAGFYRGLAPNLVGITLEKGIKLAVNDAVREFFETRNSGGGLRLYQEVAAGASAGICQVVVTNPLEVIKLKAQLAATSSTSQAVTGNVQARPSVLAMIRKLSLSGLYRGSAATLLRDLPFSILFFPSYANLKTMLTPEDQRHAPPLTSMLAAGMLAGGAAAAAVTPADVVKTRIQQSGSRYRKQGLGVVGTFRTIVAEEGPRALYRGAAARTAVQAPLFSFVTMAFELQKRFLGA